MKTNLEKTLEFLLEEPMDKTKIGPSKGYRYKEELMQVVQSALAARSDTIENQEEFQAVIDEEIEKLRRDVDMTLDMVARTLYMIPFKAFKAK